MGEWVAVPGHDHIEVTRDGKVRAAAYSLFAKNRWGKTARRTFKAHELSPHISDQGYLRVQVQRGTTRGPYYMHRLIALAFVPGYKPGYHVNHKNGVKTDNRPENLEWVTPTANTQHQWRTGLVTTRHIVRGRKRAFRSWAELFARATNF